MDTRLSTLMAAVALFAGGMGCGDDDSSAPVDAGSDGGSQIDGGRPMDATMDGPSASCGDGLVAPTEGCDDGDGTSGDGCSADCSVEDGFRCDGEPSTCFEVCTTDADCDDGDQCNGVETCSLSAGCQPGTPSTVDDGIACTVDACDPATGEVSHAPDDGACDDGDDCTDDACTAGVGCTVRFVCDCMEAADCDDGNPCTDDSCGADGVCTYADNTASCDDGLFCNGPDACAGGTCTHGGDPCAGGGSCADTCDEAADGCNRPLGTICADDGNLCTDDECDGAGNCLHPANSVGCDDGDGCTLDDVCSGGICDGMPRICDTPPDPTCVDSDTLRTYRSAGTCSVGACSYPFDDTVCPAGCASGECLLDCSSGIVDWAERVGVSSVSGGDGGRGVAMLSDGSSIVVGRSGTAIHIRRYGADGSTTWSRSFGSGSANAVATLSGGGFVVTGSYDGSVTFGNGEPTATTLSSAGSSDVFVARYEGDGTLVWARDGGGTSSDEGLSVAVLSGDVAMVTGSVTTTSFTTATFGAGEPGETAISGRMFVARYETNGTLGWAKGTDARTGRGIASDGVDGYVIGEFQATITLGAGEPGATTLTPVGGRDVFIASYRSDGTLGWATSLGGSSSDDGGGIAALADGSTLVTGAYAGTAVFGAGEPAQTMLTAAGGSDVYIARFDPSGALVWARSAGGGRSDTGFSVAGTSDGSSILVGRYGSLAATFGAGETCEVSLSPMASGASSTDIFVARYEPDGVLQSARRAGGGNVDAAFGVDVIADGRAVVTGSFTLTATFGGGVSVTSVGGRDLFAAMYSPP